jgi:nucleoside 2-deoxyribosyltransferase
MQYRVDPKPVSVYLAGSFIRKTELAGYRPLFEKVGLTVVSRWLDEPVEDTAHIDTMTADYNRITAIVDLEDLDDAAVLVLFSNGTGSFNKGGGRFVELGYMLAQGKKCITVGEPETVFQFHPDHVCVPTVDAAVNTILTWDMQRTMRHLNEQARQAVIEKELSEQLAAAKEKSRIAYMTAENPAMTTDPVFRAYVTKQMNFLDAVERG